MIDNNIESYVFCTYPKGFSISICLAGARMHLVRPSRAFNFYDTFLMYSQCAIFIVMATVAVVAVVCPVVIVALCCCHHFCSRLVTWCVRRTEQESTKVCNIQIHCRS